MSDEERVKAIAEDCPCLVTDCPIHGDCVACVRGHRGGTHIPECLQDQLREHVAALARQLELKVTDARPKPAGAESAPEGRGQKAKG